MDLGLVGGVLGTSGSLLELKILKGQRYLGLRTNSLRVQLLLAFSATMKTAISLD